MKFCLCLGFHMVQSQGQAKMTSPGNEGATATSQCGADFRICAGRGRVSRLSKSHLSFVPTPRRVHGLEIEGRDCGEAAAQWITNFLKTQPCRLVHFEPHMQPRNSHQVEDAFRPTDQVRGSPLGFWPSLCVRWKAGFLGRGEHGTCLLSSDLIFYLL